VRGNGAVHRPSRGVAFSHEVVEVLRSLLFLALSTAFPSRDQTLRPSGITGPRVAAPTILCFRRSVSSASKLAANEAREVKCPILTESRSVLLRRSPLAPHVPVTKQTACLSCEYKDAVIRMFRILRSVCICYFRGRLQVFELVFCVEIARSTYYSELPYAPGQVSHSFLLSLDLLFGNLKTSPPHFSRTSASFVGEQTSTSPNTHDLSAPLVIYLNVL
jgi:hypothetical protein